MNRCRAFFALSLLALIAVGNAHAATKDEQEKACRSDAMHFCSAEIPSKHKITACMKQHISELSPGCRAMFGKRTHFSDSSDNTGNGSDQ